MTVVIIIIIIIMIIVIMTIQEERHRTGFERAMESAFLGSIMLDQSMLLL